MTARRLDLDGAVLLFDRDTGKNVLVRGDETRDAVQTAPRVVQMALTNACNKTCGFCYRPLEARSAWTFDEVLAFGGFLTRWGVLELALGGGEPTVFPKFPDLVRRLWAETGLAINFTTNGTRLTDELLDAIRGSVGQIQLSVYDDEDLDGAIDRLVARRVRFGLNYLVTPARLRTLDADLLAWSARGVRDVLLLSYKGEEALHLSPKELRALDEGLVRCHDHFEGRMQLKVDVCWSTRLPNAPQLFFDPDCRAGALFLSVTSDRRVLSCSFAEGGVPFERFEELPAIYMQLKTARLAAPKPGCARLPAHGLGARRRRALPRYAELT
ncbi:MAG: radical SAM protein [Labilithrix sp.]|nr:radical SAM protein [Labilithrix sp.]MCW5810799.1 radical SAM protein [Labilithrix sp.]